MAAFVWVVDAGARRITKARRDKVTFGDGYSQRSGDQINSVVESWSLSCSNRTRAEIQAIEDFLEAQKGVSAFTWTTPRGTTRNFTCESWDAEYNHDWDCSISFTFDQEFGA